VGFVKLFIGKYTNDSSSLFLAEEVNAERYVTVKTMTFDKYCELHGVTPNFIKIDAEGAEYKILRGMWKIMDMHHPKLMIEIHPRHLEKQGISPGYLFDFLKEQGYEIQLVGEEGVEAIPVEELVNLCKMGRRNKYGTLINQVVFLV